MSAIKRGGLSVPDFGQYKIIVVQQVGGRKWLDLIFKWRERGIKVLYEADDHYQSVRKIPGHAGAKVYTKRVVDGMERCMSACDGMIVSTEFLARRYKQFNKRIWVCKNAVERRRFAQVTKPEDRERLRIGWAGGEGHQLSVERWLKVIQQALDQYDVEFISIGLPYAKKLKGKTIAIPFVTIENVPSVLCHFDIALAPAYPNDFFRAKSNLRWLEASALGIPTIGDPLVYPEIEDGVTGLHADSPLGAWQALKTLIEGKKLRQKIGKQAQEEVLANHAMEERCEAWVNVFMEMTSPQNKENYASTSS